MVTCQSPNRRALELTPDRIVTAPTTLHEMPLPRWLSGHRSKEPDILVGDPRVDGWETVTTFEDRGTALAWRDHLRQLGVDACCAADHPTDRSGRGDIYLVVPPDQWSRATEIADNLG